MTVRLDLQVHELGLGDFQRFQGGHDVVKRDEVKFSRKSPSQVARDRRRTEKWHAAKQHTAVSRQLPVLQHTDSSLTPAPVTVPQGVKTRAMCRMTPEIETLRTEHDEDNDVGLCDMSRLNPLVSPFMMTQRSPWSPAEEIKMTPSPSAHPSSESSSPMESPVDDIPHQNMRVPFDDSDVSSDASWTTEPGVFGLLGGCGKYMCMYGGDGDSSPSGIFTCTKCEVGILLCKICMDRGGHSRHKRYLVPEH